MCGLVGVLGQVGDPEKEMLKQLLFVDTLRGFHSTGLLTATGYVQDSFKKAVPAYEFLQYKQVDSMLKKHTNLLMGHNRYATKGEVNSLNAHPFTVGPFTGCHNGTLHNQKLLPDHERFDVDSENIYHSFDKIGVKETISKLHGAAALTWWNKEEKTFNFWRNSQRELYLCHSEDGKTLLWASELAMLHLVIDRSKSLRKWKEPFLLPTKMLVTISEFTTSQPILWKKTVMEGYTPPVVVRKTVKTTIKQNKPVVTHVQGRTSGELLRRFPIKSKIRLKVCKDTILASSIQLYLTTDKTVLARFYVSSTTEWYKRLKDSDDVWIFNIRGIALFNSRYILDVDQPVKEDAVETGHRWEDSEGNLISEAEWDKLTAAGCMKCADTIFLPREVGRWVSNDVFVCTNCECDSLLMEKNSGVH